MDRSLFFKTPLNWRKAELSYNELHENYRINNRISFHKKAISVVKNSLGANCTFLAHMREGGKLAFIAHMIVDGKKKIIHVADGVPTPEDLVAEDYKRLKETLENYGRS